MSGLARKLKSRWSWVISMGVTGSPATASVTVLPATLTSRPSISSRSSSRSFATRSITPSSRATSCVLASASRTALSAHSTLRSRSFAIDSMKAIVNFSAFSCDTSRRSPSSSRWPPPPPALTGEAAPMLVPGAMAATWPAMVMKVPAEAAQAPRGDTNTTTGTRALRIAWMMSFVDESRPPGVSSSISRAAAFSASLWRIAFWM